VDGVPAPVRAARLVAWAHATCAGLVSPDLAADKVAADDPPHRVCGLPGADPQSLAVVLARLAGHSRLAANVPIARLVLPVPGDPSGLPGPGPLTDLALEHGEVALVRLAAPVGSDLTGAAGSTQHPAQPEWFGLVPVEVPGQVQWRSYPVSSQLSGGADGYRACAVDDARPGSVAVPAVALPDLAQADQMLAEALREATHALTTLDVAAPIRRAQASPTVETGVSQLTALRQGRLDGPALAPGYPNRAHVVLARARRLRAIVELAAADDGAALTVPEADARRSALRMLDRAARYAEMAAVNAAAEPGAAAAGS